jgi:hypothetical protein
MVSHLCTRLTFGFNSLGNVFIPPHTSHLTLISTDKGNKAFKRLRSDKSGIQPISKASLTGHVYRGFHFIISIIAAR